LVTTLQNLTKQIAHAHHGHVTTYNDIVMYFQKKLCCQFKKLHHHMSKKVAICLHYMTTHSSKDAVNFVYLEPWN